MHEAFKSYLHLACTRLRDPLLHVIAAVTLVIAAVNVSTKLSDAADFGAALPWQDPVTTEYSSATALILLLPFLFAFFEKHPFSLNAWHRLLLPYVSASILFSLLHVFMMVTARQIAWPFLFGGHYTFFDNGVGALIYEYRKDTITFLLYGLIAELQRQMHLAKAARRQGGTPIILKSGATTILLHPTEFLFAKSAGNYAEITSVSGTQLARTTLAKLEKALQEQGCDAARIHRSYIVNRAAIMETIPIAGGDFKVKLRGGGTLRASRRYKNKLDGKSEQS